MPPHMQPPVKGINPVAAHTAVQRKLLSALVEQGGTLALPLRPDALLRRLIEQYAEVAAVQAALSPGNIELALHELQGHAPHAVRVDRGVLAATDPVALAEFQARLISVGGARAPPPITGVAAAGASLTPAFKPPMAVGQTNGGLATSATAPIPQAADAEAEGAPAGASPAASAEKRKRPATSSAEGGVAAAREPVDRKSSTRPKERLGDVDEMLDILAKPTARQAQQTRQFRTAGGSKLKEFCKSGTKEDCARHNGTGVPCDHIHFRRIIQPHTDPSLGDCSYLDTCRHMDKCPFVHYEVDADDAQRMRAGGAALDPFGREATNSLATDPFARHYASQFVNCDIRTFPMQVLGKFPVIMADPPWDIHMELPYGTMSDDEMRRMNVQVLQDDGVIFLWVTGRAMELGRECLEIWGYRFVQELLWVKTNQLQRIIRTGRTGHWINHSKEHCLVGIKGAPRLNSNLDCDVICAEVRETSRKPDEMYDLLERLAPGQRKLELFGRPHNVHKGWTTLGNQLGKTCITEPWLRDHLLAEGVFVEDDLHKLPDPPDDPIVPPWGGKLPPEKLSSSD